MKGYSLLVTLACTICVTSLVKAGSPVIIEPEVQPIYVQNGQPFKMVCKADGEQSVEWWHAGRKIDNQGGSNQLILSEKKRGPEGAYVVSNLTFSPVRTEDKGQYECRHTGSTTGTGYATTVEVLNVIVTNDSLVEKEDAVLGCKIVGDMYQMSSFKWYRVEDPKKELSGEKYKTDEKNGTLTIKNAMESDVGLYLCRYFMTDGGVLEKTVSLNSAPFVRKFETKSKNLVQGDPLKIDCKVYSQPDPVITWYKDETELHSTDPRVSMEEHEGIANATLRIKDMDFEDRAEYMCRAENEYGTRNSTILVRVKADDKERHRKSIPGTGDSNLEETNTTNTNGTSEDNKLAALWPFLGICAEVVILCTIIFIYERRRAKKMEEEEVPEEAGHLEPPTQQQIPTTTKAKTTSDNESDKTAEKIEETTVI